MDSQQLISCLSDLWNFKVISRFSDIDFHRKTLIVPDGTKSGGSLPRLRVCTQHIRGQCCRLIVLGNTYYVFGLGLGKPHV